VAGLTASAGVAGWVEFVLLRRTLNRRIGRTGLPLSYLTRLWGSAVSAAIAAWVVKLALIDRAPLVMGLFSLSMYGAAFFAVAASLGVPEARRTLSRIPGFRTG
jgi:putative peptidoglycan lipid II flippase